MDDGGDSYGDNYGADAFLATTATAALSLFGDADFEPRGAERRPREAERRTSSICAAHAAPPAPWRSAAAAGGRRSSEEGLRSAAAPGRRQSHDEPRASLHTTPGGTGVSSWTPARRPARDVAAEALAEAIGGSVPAAPAAPSASLRSASALGAEGEGGTGSASPPSASPPGAGHHDPYELDRNPTREPLAPLKPAAAEVLPSAADVVPAAAPQKRKSLWPSGWFARSWRSNVNAQQLEAVAAADTAPLLAEAPPPDAEAPATNAAPPATNTTLPAGVDRLEGFDADGLPPVEPLRLDNGALQPDHGVVELHFGAGSGRRKRSLRTKLQGVMRCCCYEPNVRQAHVQGCIAALMVVVILAASLAVGILAAPKIAPPPVPPPPPPHNYSFEVPASWRAFAQLLNDSVDPTVAPCDDFYAHACGRYNHAARLQLWQQISQQIVYEVANEQWPVVGTWYETCLAPGARTIKSLQPLLGVINLVRSPQTLGAALAALHQLDVQAVWGWSIGPDLYNASRNVAYLVPPRPPLDAAVMLAAGNNALANGMVAAAQAFLAQVLALLAPGQPNYNATLVWQYELALANLSMTMLQEGTPADYYVPLTAPVTQLPAYGPANVEWPTYWRIADFLPAGDGLVQVVLPGGRWLAALPTQSWPTMRAYLVWRLGLALARDGNPALMAARWQFEQALGALGGASTSGSIPTVGWCLQSVNGAPLASVMGHYYTQLMFGADDRQSASNVVQLVQYAFEAVVRASPWMDAATIRVAVQKVMNVTLQVGYPQRWDALAGLTVGSNEHLANVLAGRAWLTAGSWAGVGQLYDTSAWHISADTVNAYYAPQSNAAVFPAAIVLATFWAPNASLPVMMGSFGAVCGHELAHMLDPTGSEFAADGDWDPEQFSNASLAQYAVRAACVARQYSAYTVTLDNMTLSVDGTLVLNEAIADQGGLRAAELGMLAALSSEEAANNLEFFELTPEQLFYYAWALTWCAGNATSAATAYEQLLSDPHAPAQWRVNGPLAQSQGFAAAFNCSRVTTGQCLVF
jgi:putative endopeptidase